MKSQAREKLSLKFSQRQASSRQEVRGNGWGTVGQDESITYEGDLDIADVGPGDFAAEDLLHIYRTMLTARRLDEKMLILLKQGKGFFHIGCSGHEAAQAAAGLQMQKGHDWASVYYRDLCFALTLGLPPRTALLQHLAKAVDPSSGGRQMPEHYSSPELKIIPMSSSVAVQFLPAVGLGLAALKTGDGSCVFCSSGEGATSQGAFHEALNWAARARAPVLFFIQDNKYAISVPSHEQTAGGSIYKIVAGYENLARVRVDGTDFFKTYAVVQAAFERMRRGDGPVCLVAEVVRLLPHSSSDSHTKYRTRDELEADRQVDPITRFERELLDSSILVEEDIGRIRKEVVVEIDKHAEWALAQDDPDPATAALHVYFEGEYEFEYEASEPSGDPVVMVDAINHALHEEMARNERVIVYGEDVAGSKGGVFTATRGLTDAFGTERCFNSPLAEDSIVGTAVGFAAAGFKPVVEIQFGDYIWPAVHQLRNVVSTYRYRSNDAWKCPMVIRVPVGGYIHGGLCHSQNIEAFFSHMPGFQIAMPSNASDAKGLLKTAIRMEDPVLFLEHKALYRQGSARSPEPDADYLLPFGKARIVREGGDLTVVTYGAMVQKVLVAARVVDGDGLSVEVIDLRTLLPLDTDTVIESVKKTNRVLVVHEDHEFMGLGAEICAQIADKAFEFLDAPVRRLAGLFTPAPFAEPLEKVVLPQNEDVLQAMREVLSY